MTDVRNIATKIGVFVIGAYAAVVTMAHLSASTVDNEGAARNTLITHQTPAGLTDFELGQYYFNHGENADGAYDLTKARQYYNRVIKASSTENNLVWYQLGRIDFIEGEFLSALHKFDKQIEYFGDSVPNVYYMIGLTYGYKARQSGDPEDWERGADGFRTYIEYAPTAPWPRVDLAWIYFAQGDYAAMVEPLEEGLQYYPDNAWLLNMYGLALLNTDQKEAATEQFLLAQAAAAELSTEDWGKSYPGNNPNDWEQGLSEFRSAIEKNLSLVVNE